MMVQIIIKEEQDRKKQKAGKGSGKMMITVIGAGTYV